MEGCIKVGYYYLVMQLCNGVVHEGDGVGRLIPGCTKMAVLDLVARVCEWVDTGEVLDWLDSGGELKGFTRRSGAVYPFSRTDISRKDIGFQTQEFAGCVEAKLDGKIFSFHTRCGFDLYYMDRIIMGVGNRLVERISFCLICDSGDGVYRFDVLVRVERSRDCLFTCWVEYGTGLLLGYREAARGLVMMGGLSAEQEARWHSLMQRVAKAELLRVGRVY